MNAPPRPVGPLGAVIVLTDRAQARHAGHDLVDVVARAAAAGAGAVILREKDLPPDERLRLGEAVAAALASTHTDLVVASDPALAEHLGARGVHLAQRDAPCPTSALTVGRSCHDPAELRAAHEEGAAYATLSPVFATPSKPGHGPPLGPDAAAAMAPTGLPTHALGGITAGNAQPCLAGGFAGVAVMGACMTADDPGRVVADLVAITESAVETVR